MSAPDAKKAFGLMIDAARAAPAPIEKQGCDAVMGVTVEEYGRFTGQPTADRWTTWSQKRS